MARTIQIEIKAGKAGLFHATSPQVRGLFVSGRTVEGLKSAVPDVLHEMLRASGESTDVFLEY